MPAERGGIVAAGPPVRPSPVPGYQALARAITGAVSGAVHHAAAPVTPTRSAPARVQANPDNQAQKAPARWDLTNAEVARNALFNGLISNHGGPFGISGFAPIASASGQKGSALQKLIVQIAMHNVFNDLQTAHVLPADAKMPTLAFPNSTSPNAYMYTSGETISVPPAARDDVAHGDAYAIGALAHELAHTMQRGLPPYDTPAGHTAAEGGADAYRQAITPDLGPLPAPPNAYAPLVRQVQQRGPGWYMRGQFGG